MKRIYPQDQHGTIRQCYAWRAGTTLGFFYERRSGWYFGASLGPFTWALPFSFDIQRVWGSGPGRATAFIRLAVQIRVLCFSLSVTLWNKGGQ